MTGASLPELVTAIRAGASLPEVVAATCACGLRVSRLHARAGCGRDAAGCGGVREGRGWVQGRLAVGFSLRWKAVLNHRAAWEGLLVE